METSTTFMCTNASAGWVESETDIRIVRQSCERRGTGRKKTRGPETIKPGNGRAGEGAGCRSAQAAGTYVVCTVSGNTTQWGVRRTVFSNTVSTHAVSTISSNTVSTDAVSTVGSDTVCTDAISAVGSDTVCTNAISAVGSNTVCTDAISTVGSNAIDVGVGSTVFSHDRRVCNWA